MDDTKIDIYKEYRDEIWEMIVRGHVQSRASDSRRARCLSLDTDALDRMLEDATIKDAFTIEHPTDPGEEKAPKSAPVMKIRFRKWGKST